MADLRSQFILFLASCANIGYLPRMPGTFGTVAAVPISLAVSFLAAESLLLGSLILIALIAIAIWLAGAAGKLLGQRDPSLVVVDEVAGFVVANFTTPIGVIPLLTAFILFRFFDITKPFPIARLERLPGGFGIVLDDVAAGIYVLVIMQLLQSWGIL